MNPRHQPERVRVITPEQSRTGGIDCDSPIISCDCMVKSPDHAHHRSGCKYRLISERNEAIKERDTLAERFTKLGKPKHSGDPMLDEILGTQSPEFDAWVKSLPPTYWARYDLSAARIGWEAGKKSSERELAEARGDAEAWKREALIADARIRGEKHPDDNGIVSPKELIPRLERELAEARELAENYRKCHCEEEGTWIHLPWEKQALAAVKGGEA